MVLIIGSEIELLVESFEVALALRRLANATAKVRVAFPQALLAFKLTVPFALPQFNISPVVPCPLTSVHVDG
jgi:hypothetical protein